MFYKNEFQRGLKFVCLVYMVDVLNRITEFTDKAHGNQMRKYTPERYIVHPVRVMKMLQPFTNDITLLAAALMHDVLEDTPVKSEEIRNFLKSLLTPGQIDKTMQMVEELTDVFIKEAYPQWNRKKRKEKEVERLSAISADAQTIKYADIIDNCLEIVKYDNGFAPKFLSECSQILKKMNKGNLELHERAVTAINNGFEHLRSKKS